MAADFRRTMIEPPSEPSATATDRMSGRDGPNGSARSLPIGSSYRTASAGADDHPGTQARTSLRWDGFWCPPVRRRTPPRSARRARPSRAGCRGIVRDVFAEHALDHRPLVRGPEAGGPSTRRDGRRASASGCSPLRPSRCCRIRFSGEGPPSASTVARRARAHSQPPPSGTRASRSRSGTAR
jgi:hypothetical protein